MVLRVLLIAFAVLQVTQSPAPSLAAAPPAPAILPGFPLIAGDNVVVIWSPVPEADSYRIYVNEKFLVTTREPRGMIPLPGSGDEMRFQVTAVSAKGGEGERSLPGVVRIRKIEAPKGLEVSVGSDPPAVIMAWEAARGAIGYNIYRSTAGVRHDLLHSGTDSYFRDRSVIKGSRYEYTVAAIDHTGREGEKSRLLVVEIPAGKEPPPAPGVGRKASGRKSSVGGTARGKKEEKGRARGKPSLLDAAFREIRTYDKINGQPLVEVSFLGVGANNAIWVVLPREREIHAMNASGKVVSSLGPDKIDSAGKGFIPHKMDLAPDGRLVVSDARNGMVACFNRKGDLLWSRRLDSPSSDEKSVWEGFPPGMKGLSPTPSSVLVFPGEIWVTDQRLQLIYRLSMEGDLRGYITHYRKGGDTWRLRRVGELTAVPGKGILLTFPLVRRALLVDDRFRVVSEIVGSGKDRYSGFQGLHGIQYVSGEGILLTDPATGRIKMYDPETGVFLRDLRTPLLSRPNMSVRDADGRIWVYLAGERRIAVLGSEESGKQMQ